MICSKKRLAMKSQKNLEKKSKEVVARAKELGLDVKSHHRAWKLLLLNKSAAGFESCTCS